MNATQRAEWERVRTRGRDWFLLRKIGRAMWLGVILFGGLHVAFVLFGKSPIIPTWKEILANLAVERMRASGSGQVIFVAQGRLARTAHRRR